MRAKFDVLAEMAESVVFPGYAPIDVKSSKPFVREWEILQEKSALKPFKKGLALSSTPSEVTVPNSFLVFFAIAAAASLMAAFGYGAHDVIQFFTSQKV